MYKSPATRPSLLIRLRDVQDREAWCEFVEIYAPLVFGYARRQHLQDADAADLTQEVMAKVYQLAGDFRYDPQRGRFRGWLLAVTRNALRRHWSRVRREPRGSGGTVLKDLLEETNETEDTIWREEYERSLFRWASKRVRGDFHPSTWEMFLETALHGQTPKQVARRRALSVGAVYTAKSRVLARLREEIERIQREELADF